jgi:hypothetical protein
MLQGQGKIASRCGKKAAMRWRRARGYPLVDNQSGAAHGLRGHREVGRASRGAPEARPSSSTGLLIGHDPRMRSSGRAWRAS